MKLKRGCYCLIAAAIGAAALIILRWGCCGYSPAQWSAGTWAAAILVVVLFGIGGAIGCTAPKSDDSTNQNT